MSSSCLLRAGLTPARHSVHRGACFSRGARQHTVVRASSEPVAYTELLEIAQKTAEAGAQVVLESIDAPRTVSEKSSSADIVTETDQRSEDACLSVVREAFPDHAVLGEEGGVSGNTASQYLWCIDPLDGTTNYAHSYPAFATSVAVLENAEPVAACIVEFTGGPECWGTRTFTAAKGHGAFVNGKRIGVSKVDALPQSLLVTGFGYDHDEPWSENMEMFKHFTDVTRGVRRLGAAAVDLCHVSLGIVEAYWEYRLKPWDTAAGILMVTESGGKVTTMDGKPYSVFDRSLLASNGALHDAILEQTQPRTEKLEAGGIDMSRWYIPEGYKV